MYDRMPALSRNFQEKIHCASLKIFGRTGVAFNDDQALTLFKRRGFKVDGQAVIIANMVIGGGLCDAHRSDAQAAYEGSMMLSTAIGSGVNFILHACGQMGGHITMGYEKFLMDEEYVAMQRRLIRPLEISDSDLGLEVKAVEEAGRL